MKLVTFLCLFLVLAATSASACGGCHRHSGWWSHRGHGHGWSGCCSSDHYRRSQCCDGWREHQHSWSAHTHRWRSYAHSCCGERAHARGCSAHGCGSQGCGARGRTAHDCGAHGADTSCSCFPANPRDGQEIWAHGHKWEWDADDNRWELD